MLVFWDGILFQSDLSITVKNQQWCSGSGVDDLSIQRLGNIAAAMVFKHIPTVPQGILLLPLPVTSRVFSGERVSSPGVLPR